MKGKVEEPICPPVGEIKIIVGGMSTGSSSKARKTYLREVHNVQIYGQPPRMIREDEPTIVFTNKDVRRLHHPHDDASVITLVIVNYTTRRMLIDNESSADTLYYLAFQQMRINKELLCPVNVPLIRFGGMKVQSPYALQLALTHNKSIKK